MSLTYDQWKAELDFYVNQIFHMGLDELDDMPYARWYREGVSFIAAAKRAVKWTTEGYRPDFAD